MTLPNLYHLQYFVDAVELGSVSAAARKNLVSHSAVSHAIKSLEAQLDLALVLHRKKAFEVTPKGHALAARAKVALAGLSGLAEQAPENDRDISGTVTLGMSRSIAHAFLSSLLTRVATKHPKVRVRVRLGTTGEMMERTAQGLVDLSMTIGHQPMPTLKQTKLHEGNFALIQPVGAVRPVAQLNGTTGFILTKPQYETELLKKSYFERFQKPLPLLLEIGSWDVIAQLISDGQGYGLVPDISITPDRRRKIRRLSADWFHCTYEIYLNQGGRGRKGLALNAVASQIKALVKSPARGR